MVHVALIEPVGRHRIAIARTLSQVVDGFVYVNCVNYSKEDIILHAGSTIGYLTSFSIISEPDADVVTHPRELEQLATNTELNREEQGKLLQLLIKFSDIFSFDGKFGKTHLVKHKINTADAIPISKKPYRTSVTENEVISNEVNKMLKEGIIKPSTSPWSSPVVLVKKKDGKIRFCVDYRALNSVTVKDKYPLPLINDALECLSHCKLFTTLDCVSGYWQVPLEEEDKSKTAFITRDGLFEFETMPFGLCNAPSTFQRLMDLVMNGIKWKKVMIYLDDIIIFSKNFEQHLLDLEDVFNRLRNSNLKLKSSKCNFARTSINYLGHIISQHGIQMDPEKIKAVKDFPVPKKIKQLQTFLGLSGYYRRFIKNYAKIAKPLFDLLKKNVKFEWTQETHNAFNELKSCLMEEPILMLPDFSKEFTIFCDASDTGIGSVLSQEVEGKERVIAYYSRLLNNAEKKYTTLEKECLSLLASIKHFRPYIYGTKFNVVVDNNPLTWLKTSQYVSARLMRWATEIQSHNFEIKHRSGKTHNNADALSRTFEDNLMVITDSNHWKELQEKDYEITKLLEKGKYTKIDSLVYYVNTRHDGTINKRLVVPQSLKNEILVWSHDHPIAAHLGFIKTLERIKSKFYWNNYRREVEDYVKRCDKCARRKPNNDSGSLSGIAVGEPFEMVALDIVGPLPTSKNGNKYILVFSDYLTKYPEAFALKDFTTETIAQILIKEVILRYGFPSKLLSDRGTSFLSKVAQSVYKLLNINKINTTSYHPQTDGLVERFNKTLIEMLSKLVDENNDWDELIPYALYAYRTAVHASTKYTPFKLMFGRDAKSPVEISLTDVEKKKFDSFTYGDSLLKGLEIIRENARSNIQSAQLHQKLNYDARKKHISYNIGDLVYYKKERKLSKLDDNWIGPYVIVKRINDINYRIREIGAKRKNLLVHINKLKPYVKNELSAEEKVIINDEQDVQETMEEVVETDKEMEEIDSEKIVEKEELKKEQIEKILERKSRKVKKNKRKYYRILFKDGTSKWFPVNRLKHLKELIDSFDKSLPE